MNIKKIIYLPHITYIYDLLYLFWNLKVNKNEENYFLVRQASPVYICYKWLKLGGLTSLRLKRNENLKPSATNSYSWNYQQEAKNENLKTKIYESSKRK